MFARKQLIWLLLILLCCAGCATVRKNSPFARPLKSSEKSEEKTSELPEKQTSRSRREPLIAQADSQTDSPRYQHDPATRLLIQTELKNLPEAERQKWLAYFETVESSRVGKELHDLRKKIPATTLAGTEAGRDTTNSLSTSPAAFGHGQLGADRRGTVQQAGGNDVADVPPPVQPVSNSSVADSPGVTGEAGKGEDDRPRRFPGMPEWETPRLWPSSKGHGDQPAGNEVARAGRFPFPGLKPARETPHDHSHSEISAPAAASTTAVTADTPIIPASSVWENEMRKLISLLEADAMVLQPGMSQADQHEYLRRQVALRMLYLMENEPAQAQQVIADLPPAEQQFWSSLFWGLSNYVDETGTIDPAERATLTIEQLRSAIYHLQSKAHLELKNLNFCHAIHAFGNYETYETNQFSPGQTVLLYGEVRNFRSEVTSSGDYRSILKSTIEIYRDSGDGALVDRNHFDATEDRCRSPREDYFHSYRINLPGHLTAGPYVLKLKVEDQLSGKSTTESIPFEVR